MAVGNVWHFRGRSAAERERSRNARLTTALTLGLVSIVLVRRRVPRALSGSRFLYLYSALWIWITHATHSARAPGTFSHRDVHMPALAARDEHSRVRDSPELGQAT